MIDFTRNEVPIIGGCPRFDIHQCIQIFLNFVCLSIFERTINLVVLERLWGEVWRIRKQFPSFVGDRFDNSTLNMQTRIFIVLLLFRDFLIFITVWRRSNWTSLTFLSGIRQCWCSSSSFYQNQKPFAVTSQWMVPLLPHHIAFLMGVSFAIPFGVSLRDT